MDTRIRAPISGNARHALAVNTASRDSIEHAGYNLPNSRAVYNIYTAVCGFCDLEHTFVAS